MKKIIITIILIGSSAIYVWYSRKPAAISFSPPAGMTGGTTTNSIADNLNAILAEQNALSTQVDSLAARIARLEGTPANKSSASAPPPVNNPTPAPTPAPTSGYTDGTYTGNSADALYGLVQVQATIANGSLTNVTFLSYPSDRSTSQLINGRAMPILIQEAIAAQSANVNIVSGATDTSIAFQGSLASALAQAKI